MRRSASLAAAALCLAVSTASPAESLFTFNSVALGSALPLTMKVNGLTASFGGGGAVCSAIGMSGPMFTRLSGRPLVQGLCTEALTGPLTVSFSQPLSKISFAVAINGDTPAPVTVTFRENGTVVATRTINPVVPTTSESPEAAFSFSGTFNSISIASGSLLALDNVDAVPAQATSTTP